ncbi:MAG: NAD(P)/FAD-dependent oxidoreductase [bacterium]
MSEIYDIAIIGAGAAGSMGMLRAVLNNRKTIIFKGSKQTNKRSRALWVRKVVNMPLIFDKKMAVIDSVKETFAWIEGHEYFSKKLTSVNDEVKTVTRAEDGTFTLEDSSANKYQAKYVLLATGIMDIQPEIQGSIQPILPYANKGDIDYCIRCDGHKVINKVAATIGHGSTAAWVAVLLHERYSPPEMKIFTNGKAPEWLGDADLSKLLELYKIKVITGEILSIISDEAKNLRAFQIKNAEGESHEEPVQVAFPMLGQIAYNELAKNLGAEISEKGNVKTNEKGESSVSSFYVAGDLREGKKYQIYTAWDMAVDSVDDMDFKLRRSHRRNLLSAVDSVVKG